MLTKSKDKHYYLILFILVERTIYKKHTALQLQLLAVKLFTRNAEKTAGENKCWYSSKAYCPVDILSCVGGAKVF